LGPLSVSIDLRLNEVTYRVGCQPFFHHKLRHAYDNLDLKDVGSNWQTEAFPYFSNRLELINPMPAQSDGFLAILLHDSSSGKASRNRSGESSVYLTIKTQNL